MLSNTLYALDKNWHKAQPLCSLPRLVIVWEGNEEYGVNQPSLWCIRSSRLPQERAAQCSGYVVEREGSSLILKYK